MSDDDRVNPLWIAPQNLEHETRHDPLQGTQKLINTRKKTDKQQAFSESHAVRLSFLPFGLKLFRLLKFSSKIQSLY